MNAEGSAPSVEFAQTYWGDEYVGTVTALLDAGVVQPHQLPGAPGNGRTMVSFYPDGRRVGKGNPKAHELAGYLKVCRFSRGRLRVIRGNGKEARQAWYEAHLKKLAQEEAEALEHARCWPFPIICGEPV